MIVFENPQEIDLCAISTFGVSVKEGDNPIGFFGTGLKYAIAVLLRTGHEITIYSGLSIVDFGLRKGTVRGQEFEFVTMAVDGGNALDIGFTTQLGKQWELWMAYREIACNCKDEGGVIRAGQTIPSPVEGCTAIIVEGAEFAKVYRERTKYILEDAPDMVLQDVEVRLRGGWGFYYRGVRVAEFDSPSLFTYNAITEIQLTEDRTVKDHYMPKWYIADSLAHSDDESVLRQVLTAGSDRMEGGLTFSDYIAKPSEAFLRVVGQLTADRVTTLNQSALKLWQKHTKQTISPTPVKLTAVQQKTLDKALSFCTSIGFQVRDSFPVKVVESLGAGTLGLAHDNIIFIAARTFDMGTKYVAGTLVEEYLHLRYEYKDCTREMQNYLFDRLMSLGEELVGEPL